MTVPGSPAGDSVIEDRGSLAGTRGRDTALACLEAGIAAARPDVVVPDRVTLEGSVLSAAGECVDLDAYDEVVVLGGGKAAGEVAASLEAILGDRLDGGVVVAPEPAGTSLVRVEVGGHPLPTEQSVAATRHVLASARAADANTLVLAVVTGGGSALLAAPVGDLTLDDLRGITDALLRAGASIEEVNAVRGCLSAVKAGGLARTAAPARVLGLVLSDVVGDDLSVIASGPTVPGAPDTAAARRVLDRYDVTVPDRVAARLDALTARHQQPRPVAPAGVTNVVLANAMTALRAARDEAERRGYEAVLLSSRVRGEAREIGGVHRDIAIEARSTGTPVEPPAVLLSGGETTVTVRGDGTGGPNLEFALAAAIGLPRGITVAAVDTDGEDGSTDAAGGLVDHATIHDPDAARAALDENDAYAFLEERGALVRTGATGTNVNDLRVAVIEAT